MRPTCSARGPYSHWCAMLSMSGLDGRTLGFLYTGDRFAALLRPSITLIYRNAMSGSFKKAALQRVISCPRSGWGRLRHRCKKSCLDFYATAAFAAKAGSGHSLRSANKLVLKLKEVVPACDLSPKFSLNVAW